MLVERGYRYDSSVHPVRHPSYGVPGFEPGVFVGAAGALFVAYALFTRRDVFG